VSLRDDCASSFDGRRTGAFPVSALFFFRLTTRGISASMGRGRFSVGGDDSLCSLGESGITIGTLGSERDALTLSLGTTDL
jgi:hypothetical protein